LSGAEGRGVLSFGQNLGHEALALGDSLDLNGNRVDGTFQSFQALRSLS
jgi:hypothetical protein